MGQLYKYLIGGKKTGKLKMDGKPFGKIGPGDILYMWNFDDKGKLLRKMSWEVEEVKKSGNSIVFPGVVKDCDLYGAGFSSPARWSSAISLKWEDVSIYVWDSNHGLYKHAITTYDDEELVRMAIG